MTSRVGCISHVIRGVVPGPIRSPKAGGGVCREVQCPSCGDQLIQGMKSGGGGGIQNWAALRDVIRHRSEMHDQECWKWQPG